MKWGGRCFTLEKPPRVRKDGDCVVIYQMMEQRICKWWYKLESRCLEKKILRIIFEIADR